MVNNMDEDLRKHRELQLQSSMLTWFPKIKDLDIPQPETEIVDLSEDDHANMFNLLDDSPIKQGLIASFHRAADVIHYPLFMRTDQGSGKHRWNNTCFVEDEKDLMKNLKNLIRWHFDVDVIGLPYSAVIFREYVAMDFKFKAFNGMPIAPERRYFIRDGEIEEHVPYWPEAAIEFWNETQDDSKKPWKDLLQDMNKQSPEEINLLSRYAKMVGDMFQGYWSVDFCKAKSGKWYLIDMARGEISWNPKDDEAIDGTLFEGII